MSLCIAGVGEPMAGDDGVAVAVIERLRALEVPAKLCTVRDPSELATALVGLDRALIVDAVLDPDRVGEVRLMNGEEFVAQKRPLSSHGIDVVTAIELGRSLASDFPSVSFLAIAIGRSLAAGGPLSPPVAAAVEGAAELARRWAGEVFDA